MMVREDKTPRAQQNGEGENKTGRYVPLHELQKKYGKLYGASEQAQDAVLPNAVLAKVASPAGDKKRLRGKKGDAAIVKAKAVDLIRGFEPFGVDCLNETAPASHRSFAQVKQESAMHDAFLANLVELHSLSTELDLTFQSVKALSSGPRASASRSTGSSRPPAPTASVDEIMLDVELQKFGSTHSLIVRAPQTWELYQPGTIRRPHKIWGHRPKMIQNGTGWQTSDFCKYSAPAKINAVGDSAHTLSLEISERLPEEIVLRRCDQQSRPSSAARPLSGRTSPASLSAGRASPDGVPVTTLALATTNTRNAAVSACDGVSMDAEAVAEQLESQGKVLEKNFHLKLIGHYQQLPNDRLPPLPDHALAPSAAAQYAAEVASTSARLRASAKEYTKEYVREIRSALGLLGSALPAAARVLEGAVKGLVVALDVSMSAAWQQVQQLQKRTSWLEHTQMENDSLKSRVQELEHENAHLKETLGNTDQRAKDESYMLRERIEHLKAEIERMSPDQSDLEGVAGLMGEYSTLMQEMIDEGSKQTKIMDHMAEYTKNIVGDANADPSHRTKTSHGRVVELMNGELMLRPHDVEDQGTQVENTDLLAINRELPVRLRMPRIREILNTCANQNTPGGDKPDYLQTMLNELDADIDKIYDGKMQADQDADQAGIPRSELSDYVVEFFLESLGSVERAQFKFCCYLRFLQAADRNCVQLPLRVALFQRFLEFCEYKDALPLTVLNLVLQAKRLTQVQLLRQKANPPQQQPNPAHSRSPSMLNVLTEHPSSTMKDPQLGVALAYEAAMKALPNTAPAMRAFFVGLSTRTEVDSSQRSPVECELLVLLLLLHDRMYREGAHALQELVQRAEQRGVVAADEFREAIRDAKVIGIDDAVWRVKLADPSCPGQLSTELLLDFLGGGAPARLPGATISEPGFMVAITEAIEADYEDRLKHLEGLWQQQAQQLGTRGALTYSHFESVIHSEEPTMPAPMLRALFLTSVEISRSCSQLNGDPCTLEGSLEPVQDQYGGDVVTFRLFAKAAMKRGLFLKEIANHEEHAQAHHGAPGHHGNAAHHGAGVPAAHRGTLAAPAAAAAAKRAAAAAAAAGVKTGAKRM